MLALGRSPARSPRFSPGLPAPGQAWDSLTHAAGQRQPGCRHLYFPRQHDPQTPSGSPATRGLTFMATHVSLPHGWVSRACRVPIAAWGTSGRLPHSVLWLLSSPRRTVENLRPVVVSPAKSHTVACGARLPGTTVAASVMPPAQGEGMEGRRRGQQDCPSASGVTFQCPDMGNEGCPLRRTGKHPRHDLSLRTARSSRNSRSGPAQRQPAPEGPRDSSSEQAPCGCSLWPWAHPGLQPVRPSLVCRP